MPRRRSKPFLGPMAVSRKSPGQFNANVGYFENERKRHGPGVGNVQRYYDVVIISSYIAPSLVSCWSAN
jgi:hypothetical protein